MKYEYAASGEQIRIERYEEDDAECHSCGKIGKPRWLVHLGHLCQHFFALCDDCWGKFKTLLRESP